MRLLHCFIVTVFAVGLLYGAAPASAHDLPISDMRIVAGEETMHVELVLNSASLSFFSEIDRDKNGFLDPKELEKQGGQISKLIVDCFSFQIDGQAVTAAVMGIVPNVGSHHLTVRAHYPVDAREMPVQLESRLLAITRNSHVVEVTFQRPDRRDSARLDAHDPDVLFDYEKTLSVNPAAMTDSDGSLKEYPLLIGLAALLGSFLLLRAKHR